jgi:hypothetical protein
MSQPTGERDVDTEPKVTMEMKAAGADVLVAFRDSYDDWSLVEAVYKAMWHLRRNAEQGTLAAEIRACRRLLEVLVSISGNLLKEMRASREERSERPQS